MNERELLGAIDSYRRTPIEYRSVLHDIEHFRLIHASKDHDRRTMVAEPVAGLIKKMLNLFRQITAGPEKAATLRQLYTFPDTKAPPTHYNEATREFCLNQHPENIPSFLKFVCDKARLSSRYFLAKEEQQYVSEYKPGDDRFVLSGPKGSGKTVLLNYMLSCFTNIMDDRQVIWVRVDLTKSGKFSGLDLRFKRQTLWILANKYFSPRSIPPKGSTEFAREKRKLLNWQSFSDYLSTEPGLTAPEAKKLAAYFESVTASPSDDDDAPMVGPSKDDDEASMVNKVFRLAHRYCLTQGFSFFFVLDGLDATIPDTEHKERFGAWLDQALQMFSWDPRFAGAFLICLREESRRQLMIDYFGKQNPRGSQPRPLTYVATCPRKIVDTRFENFPVLQGSIDRELVSALKELSIEFIAEGMQTQQGQALPYLLEILNGDVRSLMKAVGLSIERVLDAISQHLGLKNTHGEEAFAIEKPVKDFILSPQRRGDLARWKGYGVLDALLLGRYQNFHIPFSYSTRRHGDEETVYVKANYLHDEDSGFLINIFDYPEHIIEEKGVAPYCFAIFHKLTVLDCIEERCAGENPRPLDRRYLANNLHEKGIPEIILSIYLSEFLYFGLISETENEGSAIVRITPAGKYVLTNLAGNFDYLMIIAENTPLPDSIWKHFETTEVRSSMERNSLRLINGITLVAYLRILAGHCAWLSPQVKGILDRLAESEEDRTKRMVQKAWNDKTQDGFRRALEKRFSAFLAHAR